MNVQMTRTAHITCLLLVFLCSVFELSAQRGLRKGTQVQAYPPVSKTLEATVEDRGGNGELKNSGQIKVAVLPVPTPSTHANPSATKFKVSLYFHAGARGSGTAIDANVNNAETYELGTKDWYATVKGTLYGLTSDCTVPCNAPGSCSNCELIEANVEITINEDEPEAVFLISDGHSELGPDNHPMDITAGVDKYEYIVFEIDDTGGLATNIEDDLSTDLDRLRLTLRVEEEIVYPNLDNVPIDSPDFTYDQRLVVDVKSTSGAANTLLCQSTPTTVFNATEKVNGSEVELFWELPPNVAGTEYAGYEVEFLRLYNNDPTRLNSDDIRAVVDWSAAQRMFVEAPASNIVLTPVFGSGYYVFRVRPVTSLVGGRYNDDRNVGRWSFSPDDGDELYLQYCANIHSQVSDNTPPTAQSRHVACFYFEDANDAHPRVTEAVIASDTNRTSRLGESRVYADAMGRPVLSMAKDRALGSVVGAASVFDYDGRASLNVIPAPILDGSNQPTASLAFVSRAIGKGESGSETLYTVYDYDNATTYDAPVAVAETSPLGRFYSDQNSDLFTPGAGGRHYSRTLYTAEGRPRTTILPGADRRPSTGAQEDLSTPTLLSDVTEEELQSLFGFEAPKASSVSKVITISPDNVASVAYIDKGGKLIATALVGDGGLGALTETVSGKVRINADGSGGLAELNGKHTGGVAEDQELVLDLSTLKYEGSFGTIVNDDEIVASVRFSVPIESDVDLHAVLDTRNNAEVDFNCIDECIPCGRYLELRLFRVDATPAEEEPLTSNTIEASEDCPPIATSALTYDNVELQPGEYVLERRIVSTSTDPLTGKTPAQALLEIIMPPDVVKQELLGDPAVTAVDGLFEEAFSNIWQADELAEDYDGLLDDYKNNIPTTLPWKITRTIATGDTEHPGPCLEIEMPSLKDCNCPDGVSVTNPQFAEIALEIFNEVVQPSGTVDLNDVIAVYPSGGGAGADKLTGDASNNVVDGGLTDAETQIEWLNGMIVEMLAASNCPTTGENYDCWELTGVWKALIRKRAVAVKANPTSPILTSGGLDVVEEFFDVVGRCLPTTGTPTDGDLITRSDIQTETEADEAYKKIRTLKILGDRAECLTNYTTWSEELRICLRPTMLTT